MRTNGGDWDPAGAVWSIGRGRMAINLDATAITNMTYENNVLSFTVPADKAAVVFGADYAKNISSEVQVTIVNDGAVVTSVDLHYYLAGDGANLAESEMTVKVIYTYDLERITIE